MNIEIHDAALEARIQKLFQATGSGSVEEVLLRLLKTQEEQDRWLLENRDTVNAKIRTGTDQLDHGEGIPKDQPEAHLAKLSVRVEIWRYIYCIYSRNNYKKRVPTALGHRRSNDLVLFSLGGLSESFFVLSISSLSLAGTGRPTARERPIALGQQPVPNGQSSQSGSPERLC